MDPSSSLAIPCDSAAGNNVTTTRPWSNLPDLALRMIAMKQTSPFAYSAFAGVCKSWRLVAKSTKSEFMASQPPLLLTIPPCETSPMNFYSLTDRKFYRTETPALLVSELKGAIFLGRSHGYLIMIHKSTAIPTLLNLCTGETIDNFPSTGCGVCGGLLTADPLDSGSNSMLIVYDSDQVFYCRVGTDSSPSWDEVLSPFPAADNVGSPYSVAVHNGMLYVSTTQWKVMEIDCISTHRPELTRVIDLPWNSSWVASIGQLMWYPHMVESNGELMVVCSHWSGHEYKACRLEFPSDGETEWVKGLGGRTVFIDSKVYAQCSSSSGHICSGRMKGDVESCVVYRACSDVPTFFLFGEEGEGEGEHRRFGSHRPNRRGVNRSGVNRRGVGCDVGFRFRVWVHPSELKRWGFSF